MTPPSESARHRRYDPAETRARVLEAAYQLFGAHGYAATGTAEIARAADVSEGSIFYHFRTKQGLLAELGRMHGHRLVAAMAGGEPVALISVETSIRRCFAYVEANNVRTRADDGAPCASQSSGVSFRQMKHTPEGEIFFQASREILVAWTTAHLAARAQMRGGQLADPALSATLLFAVVREAASHYLEPMAGTAERDAIVTECARFCAAAVGDVADTKHDREAGA